MADAERLAPGQQELHRAALELRGELPRSGDRLVVVLPERRLRVAETPPRGR
jgi:hypothetical protein